MTNPLIPHTFVPGTKAKAQEVNANFIALAEEIQNTQAGTTEQLGQLETAITERIDAVEQTVAQDCADTDLINTKTITKTILEAPNGVAEYDSQTVTVKSGVRVLIPNGKTSDGRFENLEYTTEDMITITVTALTDVNTAVFLYNNGSIAIVPQSHIFYKNSTPSTLVDNVHWYNTEDNKWYRYILSESRWVEVLGLPIANVTWNESSMISSLVNSQPLELVKKSDLGNFYTLRGVLPKDLDYVVERYRSGWEFYYIYKSGWVRQGGYLETSGDSKANFYVPLDYAYHISLARISGASTSSALPLWVRGPVTNTYIKVYSSSTTAKIWCVEGQKLETEEV